ncbi:hypothetical protein HJC23_005815 [Cyclotella cryptica]|uniref:Uncharacterized protein n=1 Tax=Cyclotella cryptica TaxID=29204 RepID=A0ABD3R3X7_9STRA
MAIGDGAPLSTLSKTESKRSTVMVEKQLNPGDAASHTEA